MWPNSQKTADLVTFTEEVLNGKLYFLCSVNSDISGITNITNFTYISDIAYIAFVVFILLTLHTQPSC